MNSNDFVSVRHLLSSITKTLNDEDYRNGFAEGWYISCIQDCLQELAFDTFYQKLTADFDFPKETYCLEMPKNCFNIQEIYVYNSACCTPTTSVRVWWKRLANNNGKGPGYTAAIKEVGQTGLSDPFSPSIYNNSFLPYHGYNTLLWFNIINGNIMFSQSCASYGKVRLVYTGMGGVIGEEPIVPRFFEQAVKEWVKKEYYEAMKSRDPRMYAGLAAQAEAKWEKAQYTAKKRIKLMDTVERESMNEYISNILHK